MKARELQHANFGHYLQAIWMSSELYRKAGLGRLARRVLRLGDGFDDAWSEFDQVNATEEL